MARTPSEKRVAERCWALIGRCQGPFWYARRQCPTRGQPAAVEFDAEWVLAREESRGDVVGFYHTHPGGAPETSQRDVKTMRAWTSAFGKPLLCVIESDRETVAYRFDNDESDGVRLGACERFPRGVVLAFDEGEEQNHDAEVPA